MMKRSFETTDKQRHSPPLRLYLFTWSKQKNSLRLHDIEAENEYFRDYANCDRMFFTKEELLDNARYRQTWVTLCDPCAKELGLLQKALEEGRIW